MLKKNGRGERIDIAFAALGGTTHITNRAKRHRGRVTLIHQLDRHTSSAREFTRHRACFGGPRRLVPVAVERQPHDESACLERFGSSHDLSDRWSLARAPYDHTSGRCNRARRIADRQADAALTIIDREESSAVSRHRLETG